MKKLFYLICFLPLYSFGQSEPDTLKYCTVEGSIGLGGYDPIGYFDQNQAVQGKDEISAEYENVMYYFATEAHKVKFLLSPSKYLPAYGGWCSMTLAMGRATTPKYDNFLVEGGELFLFERTLSVNGRELWQRDVNGNKVTAKGNYEQFVNTGEIN